MRAYVADHDCRAAARLAEVGEPRQASPDQAVVAVAWTAINRGEVARMSAWSAGHVVGWDLSGMWSCRPRTAAARPRTQRCQVSESWTQDAGSSRVNCKVSCATCMSHQASGGRWVRGGVCDAASSSTWSSVRIGPSSAAVIKHQIAKWPSGVPLHGEVEPRST